jgi:hypothetical protein
VQPGRPLRPAGRGRDLLQRRPQPLLVRGRNGRAALIVPAAVGELADDQSHGQHLDERHVGRLAEPLEEHQARGDLIRFVLLVRGVADPPDDGFQYGVGDGHAGL